MSRLDLLRHVLLLLLAADLMFVLMHVIRANTTLITSSMYALTRERGYAEAFQYIKLYWIILALAGLLWRTRAPVYLSWIVVFGYLLVDDALQVHESAGKIIAASWGFGALLGLRAVDFGELAVSAVAGLILLGLVWGGYLRSARDARNASWDFVVLIAALAFFGVVFDVLHQLVRRTRLDELFTIAEDGGEMVVISVACAYTVGLLLRRGVPMPRLERQLIMPRAVVLGTATGNKGSGTARPAFRIDSSAAPDDQPGEASISRGLGR